MQELKYKVIKDFVIKNFKGVKSINVDLMQVETESGVYDIEVPNLTSLLDEENTRRASRQFKEKLENHIYLYYPQDKQNQDEKWVERSKALIVTTMSQTGQPLSTDDLTIEIVTKIIEFYNSNIDAVDFVTQYVSTKPEALRQSYSKLLKSGIRTEWAKRVIDEALTASQDERVANYPTYPFLN